MTTTCNYIGMTYIDLIWHVVIKLSKKKKKSKALLFNVVVRSQRSMQKYRKAVIGTSK